MLPAPPPDFRLVGVEPGPSIGRARGIKLGVGLSVFVVGVLAAWRLDWVTVAFSLLISASAVLIAHRSLGPVLESDRLSEARMSIVPWGVLVHAEPEPRVLRWAAVRELHVDCIHEMDNATPSTRWSVVKIRTERETLGGRAPGDVALERLEANVERYAEEAARPVALDLDGATGAEELFEPVFERLLSEARWLLSTGELEERLALAPRSYLTPAASLAPRRGARWPRCSNAAWIALRIPARSPRCSRRSSGSDRCSVWSCPSRRRRTRWSRRWRAPRRSGSVATSSASAPWTSSATSFPPRTSGSCGSGRAGSARRSPLRVDTGQFARRCSGLAPP